jgi:hypothetical protein
MADKKNLTDAERALIEAADKKTSEKLDLMRTRLNMLEKINPDLPGAIKTALKAQSDKTSVALYKHDIENNQTTYVTGSMAMLWSIDEPLEALYDRLAKGYVREAGHYIVKLVFSKINGEIPDIEIPVCLEPPYVEPAPAPAVVQPEPENKTSEFVATMVQLMQAQQEQHREDMEKLMAGLASQAPKEDPVIKMLSEQNKALIEAFTKRNESPVPAQPPASMTDLITNLKSMLDMTGQVRNLTGDIAAPVKGAADSMSDVLTKFKEVAEFKKTVDDILGGNLDREVQAGATQIVTNERNWGTVLMNLVEKFGDKALPTITTMLGKAVVNAAQRDIDDLARQNAQPVRPAAPMATARPMSPRAPAPQRSAPQPVQPAAPSAPAKDNVIPFPGSQTAEAAKFRELPNQPGQPAPTPPPAFLPAEEHENANLPELLEEIALDMADPGLVQHGPDGETYANWVADELDRLMPGWWQMYHEKPVDEVVTELKALCYAQCPALQQHDEKMSVMIRDLHDTAKRIAQEEEGGTD